MLFWRSVFSPSAVITYIQGFSFAFSQSALRRKPENGKKRTNETDAAGTRSFLFSPWQYGAEPVQDKGRPEWRTSRFHRSGWRWATWIRLWKQIHSREASAQPVKLELKPSRRKTKGSPDPTTTAAAAAVAANGSSAAASKKLNTPPMSNSPAAGATKGSTAYERSVNGSRITMHSNLVPTETQDVSWSEIDTLDDVKNMAKEPIINDGFPPDFENRLTQMRRSHAQLLRVMRERNERLKHAKPELSRMPAPAAEKGQRGAAAKGPYGDRKGRGRSMTRK